MNGPDHASTVANGRSHDGPLASEVRGRVIVVIPAYNEAPRIGEVVRSVRSLYSNVVVVDDGSADRTADEAAAAGATVLRHVINRGQGAALQTGIEFALARGADYVVTFDGDGQHRPECIDRLVGPLVEGRWEISLGSRFLGGAENMTRTRRLLLRAGVLFTRVVSRVAITDTHNGLRAFSRRAAGKIHMTLDRMAHASELIDQVRDSGLPFGEVPVQVRYTEYSQAKGQKGTGAVRILFHYAFKRLTRD